MMRNPLDVLAVARDMVRLEECERLFALVYEESKRPPDTDGGYVDGYQAGLDLVMNLLDERIGHLRDRWTDAT